MCQLRCCSCWCLCGQSKQRCDRHTGLWPMECMTAVVSWLPDPSQLQPTLVLLSSVIQPIWQSDILWWSQTSELKPKHTVMLQQQPTRKKVKLFKEKSLLFWPIVAVAITYHYYWGGWTCFVGDNEQQPCEWQWKDLKVVTPHLLTSVIFLWFS